MMRRGTLLLVGITGLCLILTGALAGLLISEGTDSFVLEKAAKFCIYILFGLWIGQLSILANGYRESVLGGFPVTAGERLTQLMITYSVYVLVCMVIVQMGFVVEALFHPSILRGEGVGRWLVVCRPEVSEFVRFMPMFLMLTLVIQFSCIRVRRIWPLLLTLMGVFLGLLVVTLISHSLLPKESVLPFVMWCSGIVALFTLIFTYRAIRRHQHMVSTHI